MRRCCDMKGFLSFQVLRLIGNKPMSGEELRCELEKRRGSKPSPGTIYPVLKSLAENGWIKTRDSGKEKKYQLTLAGRKELNDATGRFISIFCDMGEDFKRAK
ncbi:PadR family transcriptional regulator [Candidatus Woesearchaeota archaeon]|nr:PadR family transcriptional regulator [Candidatus Woesearchaeota archaeon]